MRRTLLVAGLGLFLATAFVVALRDRYPRAAVRLANVAKLKPGMTFLAVRRGLDPEDEVGIVPYREDGGEVSRTQLSADRYLEAYWRPPTKTSGGLIVLDRWELREGSAPRSEANWWRFGF